MTNSYNLIKFISYAVILIAVFLFEIEITNAESSNETLGRFINKTFLDQTVDKIPGTLPVYCFQMNFYSSDSVNISFGFEKANFAYKKDGENFLIVNAYQKKDMLFVLNTDNSITLIDSVWTGIPSNSRFIGVSGSDAEREFDRILNNKIIAGEYFSFWENKPTGKRIIFQSDGVIAGMDNYNRYSICYSGDCIEETKTPSNIIYLINHEGAEVPYAFKKSIADGSINIYELGPQIKDIKGERTIDGQIFDLRK